MPWLRDFIEKCEDYGILYRIHESQLEMAISTLRSVGINIDRSMTSTPTYRILPTTLYDSIVDLINTHVRESSRLQSRTLSRIVAQELRRYGIRFTQEEVNRIVEEIVNRMDEEISRIPPPLPTSNRILGFDGVTLYSPRLLGNEPHIIIPSSSNQRIILLHEVVHADFYRNHPLNRGWTELENRLYSHFDSVREILNEPLDVNTLLRMSTELASIIIDFNAMRQTASDIFRISEYEAWYATKRIYPSINVPIFYGEDLVELVNATYTRHPDEIFNISRSSLTFEELRSRLLSSTS